MNELLASVRAEMVRLAKELPEFETVHAMYGVGETTAAQLMAEIGDIRNYPRRSSLVGFAGVDPEIDQSGKKDSKSKPSTKRGSPHLRKTGPVSDNTHHGPDCKELLPRRKSAITTLRSYQSLTALQ